VIMKSKITIILVLLIFSVILNKQQNKLFSQVFQPNQWCSNFPDLPGNGAIWGHASCVLGDTVYIAGGSSTGTPSQVFYKYSISGNTWNTGLGTPLPKAGGDLVACGNKLYYIGGGNSAIAIGTADNYVYDPITGVWIQIAGLPTPVSGNVAEAYRDSLIYCMMGGWNSYENIIQVYNVNTNTWAQATPMPGGNGRRSFAGGILGNKLFVCAGWSGISRNDFWIGTINQNDHLQITWQQRTNIAVPTSRPGGTAILGKFYVVMGEVDGGSANDSLLIWDTTTNVWQYRDGKPIRTNNLYGSISASVTYCGTKPEVKIWCAGGSIQGQTTRPLDVYADTCLLNCTGVLTSNNNNQNELPSSYQLLQNYPNPFNPVTKIRYEMPMGGYVRLVVSDILGRETVILNENYRQPGRYEFDFDGSNFASGVYFYTIRAGEFADTKKMLLVK
jgi:hypothetical protein